MTTTAAFLAASLIILNSTPAEEEPQGRQPAPQATAPVPLERKLYGEWQGPACGGDWTYAADGTFTAQRYSPGNNRLSGIWEVNWDALPPTLTRTCTSSDDPDLVGKKWEVKVVQLDSEALAYQYPDQHPAGHTVRYTRITSSDLAKRELEELQGTWLPLQYEEKGQRVETNFRQVIKGDKVILQVNGETKGEGKVVVDATKNPRHLNFQFTSGQTDLIIFVRAGDYVIYCGNRDGKTRPSEFDSGTAKGGEYLQVWKIER
jgi:uncharacterized protein (TIGR03067 family)